MEPTEPAFNSPRTPERAPEPPAPERPRRNLFELFGRRKTPETTPAKPKVVEAGTEVKAEKVVEVKDAGSSAPKRLGERLLAAVGVKPLVSAEAGTETATQPAEAVAKTETAKAEDTKPEKPAPVMERLVDSARKLGGNVLRIIGQARETVEAADDTDSAEAPAERTDTKPLDKAERNVENALEELDEAEAKSIAELGGGDGEYRAPTVEIPLASLRAMQENAAAEAYRDAERQIEAEQERVQHRLSRRQLGALALGALLVAGAGAVYSWRKIRHLREDQVSAEKRDLKQQKALHESEIRIDKLEREQLEHPMDRRERQAYVTEVSHYASAQAEQIREVAQDVREQQTEQNFLRVPEHLKVDVEVKKPATPELKKVIVERAGELVGGKLGKARDALTGGVVGAGGVVDFISGKIVQPIKDLIQQTPPAAAAKRKVSHDPVQTWLNGVLLILGILLVLAILLAIW